MNFYGIVSLLLLVIVGKALSRRYIKISRYDYLEVLSFHEWKRTLVIKAELKRRYPGRDIGSLYVNLATLKDEGLVVSRDMSPERKYDSEVLNNTMLPVREYKRTGSGGRQRVEEGDAAAVSMGAVPASA